MSVPEQDRLRLLADQARRAQGQAPPQP